MDQEPDKDKKEEKKKSELEEALRKSLWEEEEPCGGSSD